MPAQPSICHNTTEPIVCLLSLLYATIQPSLLYACSCCCMPTKAAVCLLRLLHACSGCCMPAQAAACLLRLLHACSGCCMPAQAAACLLRLLYACSGCCSLSHNTPYCIARQTQPAYLSTIQTQPLHTQVAIQSMYCNIMAQQPTSLL